MVRLPSGHNKGAFFCIHRSAIVETDRIETLLRPAEGAYAVRLEELERRLGEG
jgi:DNA-binding LytR/AlgR family response regulator